MSARGGSILPLEGAVIEARYRVGPLLGRGTMGAVYAGEEIGSGRAVAIKVLLLKYDRGSPTELRFLREARAAARIDHPNVVRLHDVGTLPDGAPYLAMELVHGRSLADLIQGDGALSPYEAIAFVEQTLRGLGAAHAGGVIHRDVKPENIFIGKTADGGVLAKLVDFSISKIMHEAAALTRPGDVLGTPYFLSPEQARGEPIDARSDLWSAGVVLYEALTGVLPFEADSLGALFDVICERSPHPPSAYRPGLSGAIDDAVLKALAKRPPERYQSAAEMGAALTDALIGIAPVDLTSTLKDGGPRFPDPLGDTPRLP